MCYSMLEELSDFCKNKTVCIVGPAELDNDISDFIDSHDIVVRMNTYQKLPKEYGEKKTIFIGSNCSNYNDFKCVIFLKDLTRMYDEYTDKTYKIMKYYKNILFLLICSRNDFDFLNQIYIDKIHHYTTGGYAVMIFLHIIESIKILNIVGISFGLTPYNISYHGGYYLGNKNYDYFNIHGTKHHYGEDYKFVINKLNALNKNNKQKVTFENNIFVQYMKNNNSQQ